jgi:ParB-like chromosome segregation protein Spo0J
MIHIGHISTLDRIRSLDQKQVGALAESIKEVGLLNPITVYRKTIIYAGQEIDGFGLIAGAHRLAACKTLGMQEIPAVILDLDDNDRVIAECDENLCAAKLSPSDAAMFTAERKRAYLAKHPETAHGTPGVSRQVGDIRQRASSDRFTADTAAKTGQSERNVQRNAERGQDIDEAALRLVRGTSLDTGVYLDTLKKVKSENKADRVIRDLDDLKKPKPTVTDQAEARLLLAVVKAHAERLDEINLDKAIELLLPAQRAELRALIDRLNGTHDKIKVAI